MGLDLLTNTPLRALRCVPRGSPRVSQVRSMRRALWLEELSKVASAPEVTALLADCLAA